MSIAANTGRRMQMAASFFMRSNSRRVDGPERGYAGRAALGRRAPAMRTGSPPTRLPGCDDHRFAGGQAGDDLDALAVAPSGGDALFDTLPSFTTSTLSTPANVTSAEVGHDHGLVGCADTISALANEPGRSCALRFGTSASTISVRLASSIAGLTRATRPVYDRRVALDRDPHRPGSAARPAPRARAPRGADAADACGRSSRPASRRRGTGRR